MTNYFILIFFIFGLVLFGALFYLKKGQSSDKEEPDNQYSCTLCDDKDCICVKEDSESKNQ